VIIRAANPLDAAAIAAIYAPHVLDGTATFELVPPDTHQMMARMAAGGGLYPWLVAEDGGSVLGYAYAAPFHSREAYRWAVETSVYVAPRAQGRGVGRALYGALLDGLTAQGFTLAVGRLALPNPASVALHEAMGFRAAGVLPGAGYKFGQWIDVGLWQRALAVPADPPAEPQPPR
jgi:L-amino acid N-acyltransferase YncA